MSGKVLFAFAALALIAAAPALAQAPLDPDAATRAWLATIGQAATQRSNAYFEGGYWLGYLSAGVTIAACVAFLALGWMTRLRSWLEQRVKITSLVTFAVAAAFVTLLMAATFPYDAYDGFFREHQFGLSNQDFGEWFGEYLINAAINVIAGALLITGVYAIMRAAKKTWWLWGAGLTIASMAFFIAIFPVFVAPMFNTYTPMADGPLKADILHMAQANGVPADNVYVFDVSRQTSRVTANVSGFAGTTRISLSDTLIERASSEGVRSVMGHEIGHYVLNHLNTILMMLAAMIAATFALVNWSFARLARGERWGIRDIADPAGLPLTVALVTFFLALATPINNNITRFHEQQADIFGLNAARAPDGFAEAAVMLSEYRKMAPSPLEEWFFYDHPSGYARIHMSMQWKAHEIAAGRYPPSPLGPPPGWRPDFVVMKENAAQP
jgi:STE24 endopeptidase